MDHEGMPLIASRLREVPAFARVAPGGRGGLCIRACARALGGMQKEAVVTRHPGEASWRFLCDEGPYLDGTDLAPPPLAYFAAGMAAHNARLMVAEAARSGRRLGDWSLRQDTFYTMEGSALQGTMAGGALPAVVALESSVTEGQEPGALLAAALRHSVAEAVMATAFSGGFSIHHNGEVIDTARVKAADSRPPECDGGWPRAMKVEAEPADGGEIIGKLETVEPSSDPTHGKGASLREFQKRTLHLDTTLEPRSEGCLQAAVHLVRPLGSTFRFLATAAAPGQGGCPAPEGLDYLAAGIALCFLTQMGRYAKIVGGDLAAYGVVQDLVVAPGSTAVEALDTHAWVESGEDAEMVRRYVDMSEQTCFLHASCRSVNPTQISEGRSL